jgi:Ca2+-binding EF-hand superfamily protein
MKSFLLGGLAAALMPTAALAQAPAPAAKIGKTHTRAEVAAKVQQHFARADADRDGVITQAEAQALHAERAQRHGQRADRQGRRDPAKFFDRLDSNRDGQVTRAEFDAGRQLRAQRFAQRGHHGDKAGRAGGHMFAMADANKDGRLTLQEAQAAALRHFDMVDANKDGRVTPDERKQMRARMQHGRHQG